MSLLANDSVKRIALRHRILQCFVIHYGQAKMKEITWKSLSLMEYKKKHGTYLTEELQEKEETGNYKNIYMICNAGVNHQHYKKKKTNSCADRNIDRER